MKSLALLFLCLAATLPGQTNTQEASAPPKLTEAQVANALNQLEKLEAEIQQKRGGYLASVVKRLTSAAGSDEAAMNFYLDCYTLVNSERKNASKTESRALGERMEKAMDRKPKNGGGGSGESGSQARAIKLAIRYLLLTLEANECKGDELNKMVPKLQSYIQELIESAANLKGPAFNMLNSGTGVIVNAYQISRYLRPQQWSSNPGDIGAMYQNTILPLTAKSNPQNLASLWDARIAAETTFKQQLLFPAEFELWQANELPPLRWRRAAHLYEASGSPLTALADMLTVIRENPGHADAPRWLTELRQNIQKSAPATSSASEEKPKSPERP